MPRLDLWVRFWVYAVFVAVREDLPNCFEGEFQPRDGF